ncbi:MAG: LptF/LptG family permease [Deinococcus sp.]|nr:LptF/LptG family permease [Deinococcus sp.]
MRRLHFYLIRETLPLYIVGIQVLYFMQTSRLLADLSWLVVRGVPMGQVGMLLLLRAPEQLRDLLIAGVPFGVLMALGRLGRDSELKAIFAGGISPRALLWSTLAGGVLVGWLNFANNELLAPGANDAFLSQWSLAVYQRPDLPIAGFQVNYRFADPSTGQVFYAARFTREGELFGVTVVDERGFITAPYGSCDPRENIWHLEEARRTEAGVQGLPEELGLPVPGECGLGLDTLQSWQRSSVRLRELLERIRHATSAGLDAKAEILDLHQRFARPAIAPLLAWVAGLVGLRITNRAVGFGLTLVAIGAAYGLWTGAQQLVLAGRLAPVVGAWLPCGLFLLIGLWFARE